MDYFSLKVGFRRIYARMRTGNRNAWISLLIAAASLLTLSEALSSPSDLRLPAQPPEVIIHRLRREPVDESSVIEEMGYHVTTKTLEVKFRKKAVVYRYFYVPRRVWEELRQAPSKGHYFNENIRTKYQYWEVQ